MPAFGGAWTDEQRNGDGTKTLTMQLEGARDISLAMRAGGSMPAGDERRYPRDRAR